MDKRYSTYEPCMIFCAGFLVLYNDNILNISGLLIHLGLILLGEL